MMRENKGMRALQYLILAIIAVLFLLPLVWMLFSSVDPHAIQAIKLPSHLTMANFSAILTDPNIMRSFGIGLLVSGFQAFFVVAISVLAAIRFPDTRYHGRSHFCCLSCS